MLSYISTLSTQLPVYTTTTTQYLQRKKSAEQACFVHQLHTVQLEE